MYSFSKIYPEINSLSKKKKKKEKLMPFYEKSCPNFIPFDVVALMQSVLLFPLNSFLQRLHNRDY